MCVHVQVNKTGVTHYFNMDKAEQHLWYKPLKRNMDGVVKWYKERLPRQQKSTNKWMMIINILLMFVFLVVLFSFIPLAS